MPEGTEFVQAVVSPRSLRRYLVSCLVLLLACGDDSRAASADPCAPNGERHGDHCDCDTGYRDEGTRCVARGDAGPRDAAVLGDGGTGVDSAVLGDAGVRGCGPHGELHGDHCHCDEGYVEREGVCAEPPVCVGPDDAREEDDTIGRARVWTPSSGPVPLHSCVLDEDWSRVTLAVDETVTVDVRFLHADSDIDVILWAPGADPTHDEPVAARESADDDEMLTFTATTAGDHALLVYGYDAREASYTLQVAVIAP